MMRFIPLSLRFVIPLAIALAGLAYAVVPLVDSLTLRWFVRDLDMQSSLVAESLHDSLVDLLAYPSNARSATLFSRVLRDQRLYAIGLCDTHGALIAQSSPIPPSVACSGVAATNGAATASGEPRPLIRTSRGSLHAAVLPIENDGARAGSVILLHDMSFMERRSQDTRKYIIGLFAVLGIVIALITVLIAHLSWRGWMAGARAMLRGEGLFKPFDRAGEDVQPLFGDLRTLLRQLEDERRARDGGAQAWSPERLKQLMRSNLLGDQVIVVSNREPYSHVKSDHGVTVQRPASGLVTAVEPVMRACSGTWIAHGSGSADRGSSDRHGRVAVPPESPSYTLRRIWLNKQEEQGYYFGFANEGLWPLCHIAHVRPIFRASDWAQYRLVNQRFADAVVEEAKTDDPLVLVQDYHLALVPGMVKQRLPNATIITFWHIPWPNAESFGICPWREVLLRGLLGSTIIGFHTRHHCQNFLETVDRYLEARIVREKSSVCFNGETTLVNDYPISIDWPTEDRAGALSIDACRAKLRSALGVSADHRVALGVDRLDYTKGIPERLLAVEHLLQSHPEWVGRFTFVQIAAPSRTELEEYQNFADRVRVLAARINEKFGAGGILPVDLRIEYHGQEAVIECYRGCDVCVVTSLHDGMNLVAKEFVAARDDEQGVLVLSQFAGAAGELNEALIVNPYHIEQTAKALYQALTMPPAEQRERMRSMRAMVRDFNVYRWAANMLRDASSQRQSDRIAARISAFRDHGIRKAG